MAKRKYNKVDKKEENLILTEKESELLINLGNIENEEKGEVSILTDEEIETIQDVSDDPIGISVEEIESKVLIEDSIPDEIIESILKKNNESKEKSLSKELPKTENNIELTRHNSEIIDSKVFQDKSYDMHISVSEINDPEIIKIKNSSITTKLNRKKQDKILPNNENEPTVFIK